MDCSILGFPILYDLQELAQTHVHWVSDTIQPSHPLSSPSPLPSIFPSIRVFSNELALYIRWPKYIQRWFPLGLTVLISLLSKGLTKVFSSSVLRKHQFFGIQHFFYGPTLKHPSMTTGETIALATQTFVGKVMSLLFSMLSRFVIAFLPRSKRRLISWLLSSSAVILELKKIKSVTVSTFSPSICHEVMGPNANLLWTWLLYTFPLNMANVLKVNHIFLSFFYSFIHSAHILGTYQGSDTVLGVGHTATHKRGKNSAFIF